MNILLATNNHYKYIEIKNKIEKQNILINLLKITDVTNESIDVDETELTLEGNALLKSKFFFDKFKLPTISDDTGLEVIALNNAPGVFSARFSGVHGNDQLNRQKLIKEMENISDRRARFRTVISYYSNHGNIFFEGVCEGKIHYEEIGSNGFGYDSIFIPEGFNQTFAELDLSIKNSISHRAKAIDKLISYLLNINSGNSF